MEEHTPNQHSFEIAQPNDCLTLLKTPREKRDETWILNFLSKVGEVKFASATPQVINGPDNFPYFQLLSFEPNKLVETVVLNDMIEDYLLKYGFGVVINPRESDADWMFTYGELLNYYLNDEFYTIDNSFRKKTGGGAQVTIEDEAIKVKPIPEQMLPQMTRDLLRDFLIENGIAEPKAFLMMRNGALDLVFNMMPQHFTEEGHYEYVSQKIAWFLPRHYSFVGIEESSFANSFMPL